MALSTTTSSLVYRADAAQSVACTNSKCYDVNFAFNSWNNFHGCLSDCSAVNSKGGYSTFAVKDNDFWHNLLSCEQQACTAAGDDVADCIVLDDTKNANFTKQPPIGGSFNAQNWNMPGFCGWVKGTVGSDVGGVGVSIVRQDISLHVLLIW